MTPAALRAELGMRRDPEFEMDLPAGWTRSAADDETLRRMLTSMKRRLMEAHRPDLYAQMKSMLESSFEDMRRGGVFAFFSATDPGPHTLFVPASLNASIRKAEPGQNLDDIVRSLVREQGATPLLGDKRTLRVERQKIRRMGTDSLVSHSIVYLTPVPGAQRRRALQLVAGFASAVGTPADDPMLESMRALFDSCVSTLRWRPAQQS